MKLLSRLRRMRELVHIHGLLKAASIAADWLVNRVLVVDAFVIVALDRAKVRRPPVEDGGAVTFRLARADDLRSLAAGPDPLISRDLLRAYLEGDSCLLTFVGGELAGYTWAHTRGAPLLVPGLRLRVPGAFLYNYASLTLPAFRGRSHQALRHHELLQNPAWQGRVGLLGYVRQANWSSRAGLRKSGYRELGRIWIFGAGENLVTWIPPSLRRLGIERLEARRGPQAELQRAIEELLAGDLPAGPANTMGIEPPRRAPRVERPMTSRTR